MANAAPFVLTKSSQEAFIKYYQETRLTVVAVKSSQRNRFEGIDRAYMRENNKTDTHQQAKAHNKAGNPNPMQDMTVPIVMPQVESAVVYQTSVFLTGIPIFGVVANPDFMDAAVQMETILEDNATKGGWTRELMMFFRDGYKYNFAPIEVSWDKDTVASLTTDIEFSEKEGKPTEVIWEGNGLKRLDPYNTFIDPRVPPAECYKDGEFAGYTDFLSRIALKQFIAELSSSLTMNITKAFESSSNTNPASSTNDAPEAYYVPDINPDIRATESYEGNMNWLSWAGITHPGANKNAAIQYKNSYERTTLYCKILPSEFGLKVPAANTPQIWKLIIINHQVIIHAERQTNAHGWLPILVGQPYEDGLTYQTKSLATNGQAFQELATSFMSSILAGRRRAISDRTLYDPSRITAAHINSANPSAKIPVRPAAYGKNIADSVYQFPFREDQGAFNMQQIKDLVTMSNALAGQNPAKQGQFVKGNKTKKEFDDVMNNANGRDQLAAILTEVQVFTPMKTMFKLNILQYQGGKTLYSKEKEEKVEVDPVELRRSVIEFKISDGLKPSDKIINADAWSTAMQVIGSSPEISGAYNVAPMFSYLMKTQGAKINAFEKSSEQQAYEQAVQQWQQVAMTVADKGGDLKSIPPQPLPQDFGYDPSGQNKPEIEEDKSQQVPERQPPAQQQQ